MCAMTDLSSLHAQLLSIGGRYSGKWTYALTDLTSGEHISRDEDDVMPLASLIKVPILVALYQAVHDGRLALADRTAYRKEHHCLGSGVLAHMTPGVEMSVRDAASLMIIISDNIATNMVIDLIGIDFINAQMRKLGLEQTTLLLRLGDRRIGAEGRNMAVSTAAETASLLELIARHEAVSKDASEDMLRIMRRLDGRGELTRLLPWNELNMLPDPRQNWVAEKGGSFANGVRTSGAIFHGARGHFVMSAFCEGGTGPGTGRGAEGNVLNGELGFAAWKALAADPSIVPPR
jgi:beta-lactamase class A